VEFTILNLQTIFVFDMVDSKILEEKCNVMLKNKDVRFCGIVNSMGRQVVGGYQNEITPLVDSEEHKMCMEYTLGMFITTDLDDALGATEYIVSKRKKVTMISIPLKTHLILLSVEPHANEKDVIQKVVDLFSDVVDY
jgi:hypothetical protein